MKKENVLNVLFLWFMLIFYNLILLFSPLAVLRFIFKTTSEGSMLLGIILGIIFLGIAGRVPK